MPSYEKGVHQQPLPLEQLKDWVLPSVYEWLEKGDEEAAALQAEMEAEGADQIANLFGANEDSDDDSVNSNRSDIDFEGLVGRIRVWETARSMENVDGHGSAYTGVLDPPIFDNPTNLRIVYVISESWEGYGDLLWASSRHLANQFADQNLCRSLLAPLLSSRQEPGPEQANVHPLEGLKVLELGAGCGVPSIAAMKRGAKVVVSDLDNANRIRCLAESLERNWKELSDKEKSTLSPAKASPFRWGESSANVQSSLNPHDHSDRFDVICATDCLFMPWLHYELLQALDELLSVDGVAIFAFCIHEAFSKDEEVWQFVEKSKEKRFDVETLDAVQLTPPKKGMPLKQGLVNMIRLTRRMD